MPAVTNILFVILGSLNQADGGMPDYSENDSILTKLTLDASNSLLEARKRALEWLKSDKTARWQGIPICDLPQNKNLSLGRDFGSNNSSARYYPALRRFDGRFFQTLGIEGKKMMYSSHHHILFIGGLYGLSALLEPIQRYNCPVETNLESFRIWTRDDTLTQILLDYIDQQRIVRVFDFAATTPRRRLIAWHLLQEKLKGNNVLHCFSTTAAGDDALIPFAQMMTRSLVNASQNQLLGIKPEDEIGGVVFREFDKPRAGMPREIEAANYRKELSHTLEMEKKRHGVIRFLDKSEGKHGTSKEGLGDRVKRLRLIGIIEFEEADAMWAITKLRNLMVYEQHQPTKDELKRIEEDWSHLKYRVQKHGWKIDEFE